MVSSDEDATSRDAAQNGVTCPAGPKTHRQPMLEVQCGYKYSNYAFKGARQRLIYE